MPAPQRRPPTGCGGTKRRTSVHETFPHFLCFGPAGPFPIEVVYHMGRKRHRLYFGGASRPVLRYGIFCKKQARGIDIYPLRVYDTDTPQGYTKTKPRKGSTHGTGKELLLHPPHQGAHAGGVQKPDQPAEPDRGADPRHPQDGGKQHVLPPTFLCRARR